MKKKERIMRYGLEAYEKLKKRNRGWARTHPKEVEASNRELNRKGGRRYGMKQRYMQTGVGGKKK